MKHRQKRIEELLKEVCSEIIRELKDPRIGFTTVTKVSISPDLQQAKIMVSVMGEAEQQQQTLEGLKSSQGFLKRRLGESLRLRHIPNLTFHLDNSLDHGLRIMELLQTINNEKKS